MLHHLKRDTTHKLHKPHKQVTVYNPDHDSDIEVDEGIAPLPQAMWECKISTRMSCQDNVPAGYIWIQFASSYDLEDFLDIVSSGVSNHDDLHERTLFGHRPKKINSWYYDIGCDNEHYDSDLDVDETNRSVYTFVSMSFPQEDYEYVLDKFKTYRKS